MACPSIEIVIETASDVMTVSVMRFATVAIAIV